jgi:D-alanine-D-alanine ligase
MDKAAAKAAFSAAGLPVAAGRVVSLAELAAADPLPLPYVVKPVNEGSSVGVEIIRASTDRRRVVAAWRFGAQALAEEFIPGRELTVGVLGGRALGVTEILARANTFYDYESKYTPGGSRHVLPAPIHPEAEARARQIAMRAHQALGCRGASRADFRYDDTAGEPGRLVLLEVNTQPGMTPTSLLPEQAAATGIDFPALCRWLVEQARCRG